MADVRVSLLTLGIGFLLQTTVAFAQPATHPPGLQPVSPGSFTKATTATACPSFSWAPTPRAVGYELVVHRFTDQAQLDPAPVLRTIVPGTAAAWTPASTDCLSPNHEYMWFIREVGKAAEPASGWSDGMRFSVASLQSVESTDTSKADTVSAAESNRPEGPPPTNREILARLDEVLVKLNEPEPQFSFVLCTEPAFQGELELQSKVKVDGTAEGRAGAEGFGNGAMARLKAKLESTFDGKLKGGWDFLKLGVCWDIGATVRNRRAQPVSAGTRSANAAAAGDLADVVAGLDLADLQQKLQAFADRLQIDPTRLLGTLDSLGDLDFNANPFGILGEDGILRKIAQNVPLPEKLRAIADNPSSLFDTFRELRQQGICNIDLPPALSGPIGEICQLVASEPLRPLLNRVDGAVTFIEGVVDDIKKALPSADDCKFFCK
jgi:hypothetical protein